MKAYLSVDIEGIWGNGNPKYTMAGTMEYEQYRKNMIDETNLCIDLLFQNGFNEVVVNDGHGGMDNLVSYQLDERASFVSANGAYKARGMMEGIDESFDYVCFIGYHCPANTIDGNMAHTISGAMIHQIRVNGEEASEASLNAMLAWYYHVPIGLVSGDDHLKDILVNEIGNEHQYVETKKSINNQSVLCCSKQQLRERYQHAVENMNSTYIPEYDYYIMDIEFNYEKNASFVSRIPAVQRLDATTVRIENDDYAALYEFMRFVIKVCNAF